MLEEILALLHGNLDADRESAFETSLYGLSNQAPGLKNSPIVDASISSRLRSGRRNDTFEANGDFRESHWPSELGKRFA